MKVLVIGSGGREHCLAWKIAQSDRVKKIFCAPGNGGTGGLAKNINIAGSDVKALCDFAKSEKIDLTIVGPELPLVQGIVDQFERRGLKVFGPREQLALLEGSKVFAKETMARFNVPTAEFAVFNHPEPALNYIRKNGLPIVVKADGLASGKGVYVSSNFTEAEQAIKEIFIDQRFGPAGEQVVVEKCLAGEEASILVFCDGNNVIPLASAQDHKRIFDGDSGPNTGGMGAYSPAPCVSAALEQKVNSQILQPLVHGLSAEGKKYTGVLYIGLMITEAGPKVLEFNVRFGDPETQAILPRLKNDLVEVMLATIEGHLDRVSLSWDSRACICVAVASGGYPGGYEQGKKISGLDQAEKLPDTFVFHAATKKEGDNYFTCGGRVLNVVSLGADLKQAKERVYQAIEKINFAKMYYRKDIGWRALSR
ncbi:MAG: phosphoribosylamine--glycine ligase [Candidatus Omnitrophica bacterium]|nr:phosphoribosylamine--glycine ligase [Candidatus Omnitrophota bacterium]